MIERLLAADAALERGDLPAAERLFGSVAEADPRNAIAAVGMGRVAADRDDAEGARAWFRRALEIDPDEAAALRLLAALEREVAAANPADAPRPAEPPAPEAHAPLRAEASRPARPSLLDRIRAWLGLSGRR
jgi:uncharacterized protein HemY